MLNRLKKETSRIKLIASRLTVPHRIQRWVSCRSRIYWLKSQDILRRLKLYPCLTSYVICETLIVKGML